MNGKKHLETDGFCKESSKQLDEFWGTTIHHHSLPQKMEVSCHRENTKFAGWPFQGFSPNGSCHRGSMIQETSIEFHGIFDDTPIRWRCFFNYNMTVFFFWDFFDDNPRF